jgi:hypothetical protein
MSKLSVVGFAILVAAAGCGKKKEGDAAGGDKPATGDKPAAEPAKPAEPAVAANPGPSPSKDKEWLGLELAPMGAWKPEWDPDAKVAKWSNEDYMTGIVIRVVKDKLDSIDDLKNEAPMMMQLGTAITKVVETGKGSLGWWAIVESDEGKNTTMVYVQKYTDAQIVCSGNLTPRKDPTSAGGITKDEVMKACESIKVKG